MSACFIYLQYQSRSSETQVMKYIGWLNGHDDVTE